MLCNIHTPGASAQTTMLPPAMFRRPAVWVTKTLNAAPVRCRFMFFEFLSLAMFTYFGCVLSRSTLRGLLMATTVLSASTPPPACSRAAAHTISHQ